MGARQGIAGLVGAMLGHPAAPAVSSAALLVCGYALLVALGEQPVVPPASLVAIVLFSAGMILSGHARPLTIPKLPERAASLLRAVSLSSIGLELLYFGAPITGSVPYNEFGWPVIHHLAVMHWVLVLFGTRRRNLDLAISLVIAVTLFNRQFALFAILSYLLTTTIPAKRMLISGIAVGASLLALGVLRNQTLGVDVSAVDDGSGLPMSGAMFFIYLYLTGPLQSGLALSSDLWDTQLSAFWNTVPEWASLSATSDVVSPAASFALFYGLFALVAQGLRSSRSWYLRCLGTLIHVYTFFAFFSGVVISTPIVANFLAVALAGALYPSRRRP